MGVSKIEVIVFLALAVSLITLFLYPGLFLRITGFALTGEGQVRVNITENAALNLTRYVIDFGNGTVATGSNNCTMSSDTATPDTTGCFTPNWGSDGPGHGGFLIENIGNVNLNISITATKNSTSFWGVLDGRYWYKCQGNGTVEAVIYTTINGSAASPQAQNCTRALPPGAGSDGFRIDINITIPQTATGFKNDTITVTGVKS